MHLRNAVIGLLRRIRPAAIHCQHDPPFCGPSCAGARCPTGADGDRLGPGCRDVTFDEDRCQVRKGHGPQVLACLRNAVIGLLRRLIPACWSIHCQHDPPFCGPSRAGARCLPALTRPAQVVIGADGDRPAPVWPMTMANCHSATFCSPIDRISRFKPGNLTTPRPWIRLVKVWQGERRFR